MPRRRSPRALPDRKALSVTTNATAADIETLISELAAESPDQPAELTLSRNLGSQFFIDTWASILLGTAARLHSSLHVIDWSPFQSELAKYYSYVLRSVPATTAVCLADKLTSIDGSPIALTKRDLIDKLCDSRLPLLEQVLQNQEPQVSPLRGVAPQVRGMLHTATGESNTVCEFDPLYSLADLFTEGEQLPIRAPKVQFAFRRFIFQLRTKLEFGAANRGLELVPNVEMENPNSSSTSETDISKGHLDQITDFLKELHENSYEYGRLGIINEYGDRTGLDGVRFLRFRKHVGDNVNLLKRAEGLPPLHHYLSKTLKGKHSVLIEATVSDFGLGLVDFVRTSAAGPSYVDMPAREILTQIFQGNVSSRIGDPGAGLGINKALQAARQIAGFVGVRTGKHWLQRGYHLDDEANDDDLEDMFPNRELARVSGTHWIILYHQHLW